MRKKRFSSVLEYTEGDTITYQVTVKPEEICYIQGLMEAYEGVAAIRTRDAEKAVIEFWVPKPQVDTFENFLKAIWDEVGISSVVITEDRFMGP